MEKTYSLDDLLNEFASYLLNTRRLSEETPRYYINDIKSVLGKKTFRDYQELIDDADKKISSISELNNLSIATLERRVSALNTFLGFLEKTNRIEKAPHYSPFKKIEKKPINTITQEEFAKFIGFIPDMNYTDARDRAIFSLMFYSGIKESEARVLEFKDIKEENETFSISVGKGYSKRNLEVNKQTAIEINNYLTRYNENAESRDRTQLTEGTFFKNKLGKKISARSIRRKLEKWVKIAGIEISPTNLRYSYAQRQAKKAKNNKELAGLLGITSTSALVIRKRLNLEQNQEP